MNSTKTGRILLWGFPILIVGVLIFFFIAGRVVQSIDQSYKEARQALGDWIILDRDCSSLLLDNSGKVWVGGEFYQNDCGGRPYMFDGTKRVDIKYRYSIKEFAVDLAGQVWVIPNEWSDGPLISVYDGKIWKNYRYQDMGMSSDKWSPSEIEVDSMGRVWVEIFIFDNEEHELLIFENETWKLLSSEDTGLPADESFSIKSDAEGRIWLTHSYLGLASDDVRLYVFDGINSRQILYNGERLKNISDIAFDKQNHLWIVDGCGNIAEFTDLTSPYLVEKNHPELNVGSNCKGGGQMHIDGRERIWLWGGERVRMLENGTWMTLTLENSGLVGDYDIYDLVVDDLDRVWILSDRAIHMIPVKDIQTLPQELVDRWNFAISLGDFLEQTLFLIPIELVLIWILVLLNLNVRQWILVNDSDNESTHKVKRLAKSSLFFGNFSLGTPCLFMFLLILEGGLNIVPELFAYVIIPLSYLIVTLNSIAGLITAANALRKIKKEGWDNDNMVKKTAYRGIALSLLGIAFMIIATLMLPSMVS